jgi:DNA/RNA endonuclease YhcR with UshA esterase domain
MISRIRIFLTALVCLCPAIALAAPLTPNEAASHVGETATICGTVAAAHYAESARGQPTFLNIGQAQAVTAVIWGDSRAAFGEPERTLMSKHVCVTGVVQRYRGQSEIVLRSAEQLKQ